MKRIFTILALTAVILSIFARVQWRKCEALTYLDQYGNLHDWHFFGHPLARELSIPRWLPGVWPRSLAVNDIPPDAARYAGAIGKLPRLDTIMVFVYEPMSMKIFTALGAVPGAKLLDLTSTSVNDSAFQHFTQFATVETLLLNHSTITDASVTHILKFRRVHTLDLYENTLSDSAAIELAQLPALREVSLDERVSPQTIAALRAKRHDVRIDQ